MNTQMNLQRIRVDKLKPAKYNPRKDLKPGDPAYEKIKRSLHDFGYVDPVIWNEVTGNIIGGHQRYKVLKAEGVTEIDCVVVHIENPQDEKALNVALNKAVGEWEPKALADLLQDLQLSGYDVGATGFDAAEVDDLFSKVHDKNVKDDDCEAGKDILQVSNLCYSQDGVQLLKDVSFIVTKGQKIALVGSNEQAQTALFRILAEELTPDSGSFKWGVTITTSYFPKDNSKFFDGCDKTMMEWFTQYSPEQLETYMRGFLGRMLFSGDDVYKPVSVLSGGEKVRCMLSRMMLSSANFLMLDQPTNHLDLESITAVNNALINFPGNVLFTSQDHQFIPPLPTASLKSFPTAPSRIITATMRNTSKKSRADKAQGALPLDPAGGAIALLDSLLGADAKMGLLHLTDCLCSSPFSVQCSAKLFIYHGGSVAVTGLVS